MRTINEYIDTFMKLENKHSYQAALLEKIIRDNLNVPRVNLDTWIKENIERYRES